MKLYLSKLALDARHPQTRSELDRPHEIHRTLSQAFANVSAARILFRAERPANSEPVVLVQSQIQPDWERARARLDHVREVETREFGLTRLREGQQLRFKLQCRPSRREFVRGGTGRRIALTSPEDLFDWLAKKGSRSGFQLVEAGFDRVYWLDSRSSVRGQLQGVAKSGAGLPSRMRVKDEPTLGGVLFEGTLSVTDSDALRTAVSSGIGPQKAFGFGLLSLASI